MKMTRLDLYVPDEDLEFLEKRAAEEATTKGAVARRLMRRAIRQEQSENDQAA